MPEWVRVAGPEECRDDGCLHRVLGHGEPIVLARWNGEVFALEDCCSHEDFPLSEGEILEGEIECILHGARFDLRTGRPIRLPAVRPVRTFPVEVRADGVYLQVES